MNNMAFIINLLYYYKCFYLSVLLLVILLKVQMIIFSYLPHHFTSLSPFRLPLPLLNFSCPSSVFIFSLISPLFLISLVDVVNFSSTSTALLLMTITVIICFMHLGPFLPISICLTCFHFTARLPACKAVLLQS